MQVVLRSEVSAPWDIGCRRSCVMVGCRRRPSMGASM